MGKENFAVNQMLERKDIFADLMNGTLFDGRQILKPEDLELISTQSGVIHEEAEGKKIVLERRGDIRMKAEIGTYLVILANESQNKVHYAMPVRNMLYDALEYMKQVQALEKRHKKSGERLEGDAFLSGITREDKLIPVVTTVLYLGAGTEWDGSKSLYELLGIDEKDDTIHQLKEYLPDYKINLIQGRNIRNPEKFQTCLQHIFSMLKYNSDKKRLYEYITKHQQELKQMDNVEMLAAFVLLGEQKRVLKLIENQDKKEETNMCSAIEELIQDGKEEGQDRVNRLNQALAEKNRINDIIKSASDKAYQKKLFAEFNL